MWWVFIILFLVLLYVRVILGFMCYLVRLGRLFCGGGLENAQKILKINYIN